MHWCKRRVKFNRVPEKVPEKVPETLVQSQVTRFRERFCRRFWKAFGVAMFQQISGERICEDKLVGVRDTTEA